MHYTIIKYFNKKILVLKQQDNWINKGNDYSSSLFLLLPRHTG